MKSKPISENEMILAFLQAEINSPRFGNLYQKLLVYYQVTRAIIDSPNLEDVKENEIRESLLSDVRGYKRNIFLFETFPDDINWFRVTLPKEELKKLHYANMLAWVELSGPERLAGDGAKNLSSRSSLHSKDIFNTSEKLKNGETFPSIICIAQNFDSAFIILEGHTRVTAFCLNIDKLQDEIDIIVGISPHVSSWCFY